MKSLILPLLFAALASLATGQDAATSPAPSPNPSPTPKVQKPPQLELFDRSLYKAEPFLDFCLQLPKEKFDALLAANAAHKNNPDLKAAKAAQSAASDDEKEAAGQAKREAQLANDAALMAVRDANLTEEQKSLIETLNRITKAEKENASADVGFTGLSKYDPQFKELKEKSVDVERERLRQAISSNLSEEQKAAIEKARTVPSPAP